MNLGGIYTSWIKTQIHASLQDGSDKENGDTSIDSDSSSVNDTDLAAGAILVPQNNPKPDHMFAIPRGKNHYVKYCPRQI